MKLRYLYLFLVFLLVLLWGVLRPKPTDAPRAEPTVSTSVAEETRVPPTKAPTAASLAEIQDDAEASLPEPEPVALKRGANNRVVLSPAEDLSREHVMPDSVFAGSILQVVAGEPTGPLTMSEHTISAIEARFDADLLAEFEASGAEALRLPIAEGTEVLVQVERVIARGAHTRTLAGKVAGEPTSDVLLVFHDGAMSGTLSFFERNEHYEFAMAGNGNIAIRRLDPDSYTAVCGNPEEEAMKEEPDDHAHTEPAAETAAEPPAGSMILDTVIGYSIGSRQAQGGVAAIEAHIIAAVDRMNRAFENSEIENKFVALLGMIEDPDYVFPGTKDGMNDELWMLDSHGDGKLDVVSQLRKDLGADHNGFIIKQTSGGAAGIARRPGKSMIVARTYMTNTRLTFAHEFGHNIGCNHSWGDTSADSAVSHSRYGLRIKTGQGAKVRTIMAYDWGWTRIPYFSNPDVKYGGTPTGARPGTNLTGNNKVDQRYVSGGKTRTAGAGFDGTNPLLGAMNAQLIMQNAGKVADNARRRKFAVISPTLGDRWNVGERYEIYWTGGDHTDTVSLELFKDGLFHSDIANNLQAAQRGYDWELPNTLPVGTNYSIHATFNADQTVRSETFALQYGATPPFVLRLDAPIGGRAALASTNETVQLEATSLNALAPVVYLWEKLSGPGHVLFGNPTAEDTTAQFDQDGIYTLRLTAGSAGEERSVLVEINVGNTTIISDTPFLHYSFDQDDPSLVRDVSGNDRHAVPTGSPRWVSGRKGTAIEMTGNPSYIQTQDNITVNNSLEFSVMGWVRQASGTPEKTTVFRQEGRSGRVWLKILEDGRLLSFIGGATTISTRKLPRDEWHHVAVTAGNGFVRLYLDGEEVASSQLSVETATGPIRIGRGKTTDTTDQFYGLIDDVRIYPRTLVSTEINLLLQTNQPPVVDAGPSSHAVQGRTVQLQGQGSDDGEPAPASLTFRWEQLNGPAQAVLTDPTNPTTSVLFPAAGEYRLRLTAEDGQLSAADEVSWTAIQQLSARQWRNKYFGISRNRGVAANEVDYDNDGLNNLMERAFGTDPTNRNSYAAVRAGRIPAAGGSNAFLSITYPRLAGGTQTEPHIYEVEGIRYLITQTGSLTQSVWSVDRVLKASVTPPTNGIEQATYRLDIPMENESSRFMRLDVEPQ